MFEENFNNLSGAPSIVNDIETFECLIYGYTIFLSIILKTNYKERENESDRIAKSRDGVQ